MKLLFLSLLVLSVGCGKGGTSAPVTTPPDSIPANPIAPVASTNHIYTITVTGDGTYYSLSMSVNWLASDVQTIAIPNTNFIPAGQTLTYNLTGRNLRQARVTRWSTPGARIVTKLYRDGVLQESANLDAGLDYNQFQDWD